MNGFDYALLASVVSSGLLADGTFSSLWEACKTYSEIIGFISAVLAVPAAVLCILRWIQNGDAPPPAPVSPAPASARSPRKAKQVEQRMRELRLTVIKGTKDVLEWLFWDRASERSFLREDRLRIMNDALGDMQVGKARSVAVGVEDDEVMTRAELSALVAAFNKTLVRDIMTVAPGMGRTRVDENEPWAGLPPSVLTAHVRTPVLDLMRRAWTGRDRTLKRAAVVAADRLLKRARVVPGQTLDVVRVEDDLLPA